MVSRQRISIAAAAGLTALFILAAAAACASDSNAPPPAPEQAAARTTQAQGPDYDVESCAEGIPDQWPSIDLAAHVYDGAVAHYLRVNASGIGNEITAQTENHAMLLLVEDRVYESCVELPQHCLRAAMLRSEDGELDRLLETTGSRHYREALDCLQRAGARFDARAPPEMAAADLAEKYRTAVLPHLVGNMMPAALLRDSSFFSNDDPELHEAAVAAWRECYDRLAQGPLEAGQVSARISDDLVGSLECAHRFREQTWPDTPTPANDRPE